MGSFCPECKGEDLVTDVIEGKVGIICNDCGAVVEDLATEADENESNSSVLIPENPAPRTVLIDDPLTLTFQDQESENGGDDDSRCGTASFGSSRSRECQSCRGKNIVLDVVDDSEQLVCRDCGYFVEQQHLVSGGDYVTIPGKGDAVYSWSRAPKPKHARDSVAVPKGKIAGLDALRNVCSQLNVRPDIEEQAVALFERIYSTRNGTLRTFHKDVLGVACAYVTARQNGTHITIRTLKKIHPVNLRYLHKYISRILRVTKEPLTRSLDSMVQHVLAGAGFSLAFQEKVAALIRVTEKAFLAQGRDYTKMIVAVAYLVHLSEEEPHHRKTTYAQFCRKVSVQIFKPSLVLETKNLLTTLANQLPWVHNVTKSNVLHYIDDILRYNRSVVSRANSQQSVGSADKMGDGTSTSQLSRQPSIQKSSENYATDAHPLLPPSMVKPNPKRPQNSARRKEREEKLPANIDRSVLDSKVLREDEFDDEISQYLLSPEEVKVKSAILNMKM